MLKKTTSPVAVDQIDRMIRVIRGVRVMLDRDLSKIYGVPTKAFNQAMAAAAVIKKQAKVSLIRLMVLPSFPRYLTV